MTAKENRRKYYLLHREKILTKNKKYYHENPEKRLKTTKKYYLLHREKICAYNVKWYYDNRERRADSRKKYNIEHREEIHLQQKGKHRKDRLNVYEHYSGKEPKCACCGESKLKFLSVDHINGGGYKHLKINHGNICGWLVRNNFPKGFQILCFNCNLGKNRNKGICPHKEV